MTTQSADPAYHDLAIPDIVVHLYDNDVAGVFVDLRKFYGQVISVAPLSQPRPARSARATNLGGSAVRQRWRYGGRWR